MFQASGVAQPDSHSRLGLPPRPKGRPAALREPLFALCLVLPLGACRNEPEAAASTPSASAPRGAGPSLASARIEPKAHFVGQLARAQTYAARVSRIIECSAQKGFRPGPEHALLGVELEVRALENGSIAIGHSHTRLNDANGHHFSALPAVKTEDCTPLFKYTRLAPGQSEKGWLVYDLPRDAHSLVLELNPRPYLRDAPILFQLGR